MIFLAIGLTSFLAGISVMWAASRYGVCQAQVRSAARFELRMEYTSPVDLVRCHASGVWQERP
jgi:hypothetical protein